MKNKQIACGRPIKKIFFFFKISCSSDRCLGLDFFHAMDFGGSKHSVEKVYEVYICLSLVGALYPSELELPVISGLVQVSPIFSTFL